MSGHSHWAQIKRQKGSADAKRGQLFTKLAREITIAVRQGGGSNPDFNTRLRLAIQTARDNNMPLDNIERAVKRGGGADEKADALEEAVYEGYGPGGAAVIVRTLTDNRNRTSAEIRTLFAHNGGALGETGTAGWNFDRKGQIVVEGTPATLEQMALTAIDAGAEDFRIDGGVLEVVTTPEDLEKVRRALEGQGATVTSADVTLLPKTVVDLDDKAAIQNLRLLEKLEELDDVQRVYCNGNFPDHLLQKQASS